MNDILSVQSRSRYSGSLNSGWSTLAGSKSLVTASTRYSEVIPLFRYHPPIAWYPAIESAPIAGTPRYKGTDAPYSTAV